MVSSSCPVPASNAPGENPPHAVAKARYAEIADVCGISEGAARVRVHRALEDLRRMLLPTPETPHDR